jgi:hypothetical protein
MVQIRHADLHAFAAREMNPDLLRFTDKWSPPPARLPMSSPSESAALPGRPAEVVGGLSDSLCKLAFLEHWFDKYRTRLERAVELAPKIEKMFRDPELSPDNPEPWLQAQRAVEEWRNDLSAINHVYQQCFGIDKNLSLSLSWHIGRTPIEGQSKVHPQLVPIMRHYYDQKDQLYREMPEMNRKFAASLQGVREVILERGRELVHKERQ